MERIDTRPPFAASGGVIPPELRKIKTPCYVLDEAALIKNAELMGNIAKRTGCKMLLAQKAFSNYDCYQLLEPYLTGTEASGLYEARLGAQEMPGKEVHVFCAGYREDEFEELLSFADHIVFNSPSQLLRFGKRVKEAGKSAGLRINPECSTRRDMLFMILCSRQPHGYHKSAVGDSGEKASGADRIIGWYSFSYPL